MKGLDRNLELKFTLMKWLEHDLASREQEVVWKVVVIPNLDFVIMQLDFVIMQSAVWVWLIDNIVVKEWVKKLFSGAAT